MKYDEYGWTAYHDKVWTPCAYCGKPSVQTFTAERATGHSLLLDIRVGLCREHKRRAEPRLPTARGVDHEAEQFTLDVGDV